MLEIRRREFVALLGGAAAWPLAARAQQRDRVQRIGVLLPSAETDEQSLSTMRLTRDELQKLGWIEGRNMQLDFLFGDNFDENRTRSKAAELVKLAPDVIITVAGAPLRAAREQTETIPIVFLSGEGADIGENIARPEANVTGFRTSFVSLGGKWLELLKEAAPNVTRVAYLVTLGGRTTYLASVEPAARALGVQLVTIPVSDAAGMKMAIENFAAEPNGGLIANPGIQAVVAMRRELIRLAQQYRLPVISTGPFFAVDGGLLSYDTDPLELFRRAVTYVDRILRGAKVSELPVQFPSKFRLVVNLKTAKTIGVEIPPTLRALATDVIE